MKIDVILERGTDGTYDARMEVKKELSFWLLGQGNTVEEAIADFYVTKDDMKALFIEQGKKFPELEIFFFGG
ncbi:MAG: hypothetical protein LBT50_09165 [Prevotellaceae bacterium]|jgi:predicted RNase H-like HicB family nuclease|nr:hypothetical protein [Prevotellaceae bacterium]